MKLPISHFVASLLEQVTGSGDVSELMGALTLDERLNLYIDDASVAVNAESTLWSVNLWPIQTEIPIPVFPPEMGTLTARLGDEAGTITFEVGSQWDWVEINSIGLVLTLNSALLRSTAPDEAGVRIEFTSGLLLDRDGNIELLPHTEIAVGPAYLGNTDIILMLQGLQPMLRGRSVPLALEALVADASFKGVYVDAGYVRFLNDWEFGGTRGIQVEISRFMVTRTGLSGQIRSAWPEGLSTRLFGLPNDDWELRLYSLELALVDNFPQVFRLTASVAVPLLPDSFSAEVSLHLGHSEVQAPYRMILTYADTSQIDFGFAALSLEDLRCEGVFGPDEMMLAGRVAGVGLSSDALSVSVADAQVRVSHTEASDKIEIALNDLDLGAFALPKASLVIENRHRESGTEQDVYIEGALNWQDLAARLTLPDFIPAPPDDAQIAVQAHWERQPDGSYRLTFALHMTLTEVDRLWPFIPSAYRPAVDQAELVLKVTAAGGTQIQYRIEGKLSVRLPDLATLSVPDFITLSGGDPDGRVRLEFSIDDTGQVSLTATNALRMAAYLPGLQLQAPPFLLDLDTFALAYDPADQSRGEIAVGGRFRLEPILLPPSIPVASHINQLFAHIGLGEIESTFQGKLAFTGERVMWTFATHFVAADIAIDPLALLGNLSVGRQPPRTIDAGSDDVALNTRVGFGIEGVRLQLGSLNTAEPAGAFEIELTGNAFIAGFGAHLFVTFSDQAFELGVRGIEDPVTGAWNTDLPVRLPLPPVAVADVNQCAALGWNVARYAGQRLEALADSLGLSPAELEGANNFDALKAKAQMTTAVALLTQVAGIRNRIAVADRQGFVDWVKLLLGALESAAGYVNHDLDVTLRLEKFAIKVPFGDPRDMGVEGSILIFAADTSPLYPVMNAGIRLNAGLSADLIYFEADGPGNPIEIPAIGRYSGGSVRIGTLRLGYGYTSNSFNFVVDGGIQLPPALIADMDTTKTLGAGIRQPSVTNLYFRLGIIPIPGPIPAVPLVDFNLDMRTPNLPALQATQGCVPQWDGLQLIVPDVIRADIKHLAFGILFSGLPIPHHRFDGDLVVGPPGDGVSIIVDNYLSLNSLGAYQIPLLVSSSTPFFDNICVSVRIAGFSVNFDMQHPYPEFTPQVVLETLALLSSDTFDLDPHGELANIIRVAVRDVTIAIPDWAQRLFPGLAGTLPKDVNVVFNIADLVPAIQALKGAIETAVEIAADASVRVEAALNKLVEKADDLLDPNVLLRMLPASYRKFRTGVSLAGFEARCALLLMTPSEAAREFDRRGQPAAVDTPEHALPRPAIVRTGERPHDGAENLLSGREFRDFSAADLAELSLDGGRSAIVIAARVKIFQAQRYRFLGYVADNGKFTLISTFDARPLRLAVAGIDISIPVSLSGRLWLRGRTLRDGGYAEVGASGFSDWRLIPGIVEAAFGNAKEPVQIVVESGGRFHMTGSGSIRLGSARIDGAITVSHAHARVEDAAFVYETPVIGLFLQGDGGFGPGARVAFSGEGTLHLFTRQIATVRVNLTNTSAELSARIDTRTALPDFFGARIAGTVSGWLSVSPSRRTRFHLTGAGEVSLLDATIAGNLEIRSDGRTQVDIHARGALTWMGHEWLSGYVTFSQFNYALGGRTRIAVPLTYSDGQIPQLVARLDLGAKFRLNKQTGHFRWSADAGMEVGLQLASGQFIPMVSNVVSGGGGAAASIRLIRLDRFSLIPGFEDVELVIPDIESDGIMDVVGQVGVPPIAMRKVDAVPDNSDRPAGEVPLVNFPLFKFHGFKTVRLQDLSCMPLPVTIDLKFKNNRLVLDVGYNADRFEIDLVRPPA